MIQTNRCCALSWRPYSATKTMSKNIQNTGRSARDFLFAKILFKFRILRSVTFGYLNHQIGVAFGDILPTFGHPGRPLGPPGSHLATDSNFERLPGKHPHILVPCNSATIGTGHQKHKKTVSRKRCRKKGAPGGGPKQPNV